MCGSGKNPASAERLTRRLTISQELSLLESDLVLPLYRLHDPYETKHIISSEETVKPLPSSLLSQGQGSSSLQRRCVNLSGHSQLSLLFLLLEFLRGLL